MNLSEILWCEACCAEGLEEGVYVEDLFAMMEEGDTLIVTCPLCGEQIGELWKGG